MESPGGHPLFSSMMDEIMNEIDKEIIKEIKDYQNEMSEYE